MNNLLIFFAFPVATIIFAVALQKILRSPFLVAAVIFAIFLIVTFAVFDDSFLVYAILYALLALLTALATRFICCLIRNSDNPCLTSNAGVTDDEDDSNNNSDNCCCNNDRRFILPYTYRRNRYIR